VGDAGVAGHTVLRHLGFQFGHARGAARAARPAVLVHGHAAGVIAAVFQALQAFDQDGDDVALAGGADDAAHGRTPQKWMSGC
jgi:hypothetical protein